MNRDDYQGLFNKIAGDQRLEEIESQLKHLRKGAALSYEDLETIADSKYWPFNKYWMWPHRDQIDNLLPKTKGWFINLPDNEKKIITGLDKIFKNISHVSIILRFAVPEYYAIYSSPPLKILRIERGDNEVDEYLEYLYEMRILKDSFGVKKTAEVDKIVWAIFHLREKYAPELKRIMAKKLPENLTAEELVIYLSHDPLKVAKEYLKRKDHMTAGFWAAKAFEKFLDDECRSNGIYIPEQPNKRSAMIKALREVTLHWRKPQNRKLLYDTKTIRNRIVPGVMPFGYGEVEEFILNIEKLKIIAIYKGY